MRVALVVSLACLFPTAAHAQVTYAVTAPDGVRLATDVHFPVGHGFGPWPAILQRTPYGRQGGMSDVCRAVSLLGGYVCVVQDERGTGDSEGRYSGYLDETADGQATLDWLADQPWCDGRIGTFGASALGMTQYAMAPGAISALRAQVPIVATADFFHHAVYHGGALRYGLVHSWLSKQGALDVFDELRRHRTWDAYWQSFDVVSRTAEVNTAGLHIGGWYDIFLQGTLDAFTAAQHRGGPGAVGAQRLIVGPWTHYGVGLADAGALTYPANAVMYDDFVDLFHDWFDHHLLGEDHGVDAWPVVRIYLMGPIGEDGPGNRWLELGDWPPDTGTVAFQLDAAGGLSQQPAASGEVVLTADPYDPVPTRGGRELLDDFQDDGTPGAGPHDQRPVEARADVLEFTSEPLERPLIVVGRVRAHVRIRPDTPDLDLSVRLTDVHPDGRSMLVADGIQRARARCGDARECLLIPGEEVELTVDLWSTAYAFNPGHRIRLDIAGSNWPRFEVNPNTGGDLNQDQTGVVGHPVLLLGGDDPTRVELPVLGARRPPRRLLPRSGYGAAGRSLTPRSVSR